MNNCQLWIENLERHGQNFLYSIQHLNNLESIRNYGILSRKIIEDNDNASNNGNWKERNDANEAASRLLLGGISPAHQSTRISLIAMQYSERSVSKNNKICPKNG